MARAVGPLERSCTRALVAPGFASSTNVLKKPVAPSARNQSVDERGDAGASSAGRPRLAGAAQVHRPLDDERPAVDAVELGGDSAASRPGIWSALMVRRVWAGTV